MSLRRDIHTAFDVITPPLGGVPERVVQTVLAENKGRRRNKGMFFGTRVSLPLVALFVFVVLAAALFGGGRLIQAWNTSHNTTPAGQVHLTTVQQLEARPLVLPQMKESDACAEGPFDDKGRYGKGPVYGVGANPSSDSWAETWNIAFVVSRQVTGPVLIRGRDLKTQQSILWSGSNAYGPLGDSSRADLHTEMLITMGSTAGAGELRFPITSALKAGHSDCVGVQIDGSGFSEHFTGGA